MPRIEVDLPAIVSYMREHAGKKHINEIAINLGYSVSFINKIAKSQAIDLSVKKPVNAEIVNNLRKIMQEGMTVAEASKIIGVHRKVAWYHAVKAGITIPPRQIKQKEVTYSTKSGFFNVKARENWLV